MIDPDSLLIGVVAHTSRLDMANHLVEQTAAQVFNVDDTHADNPADGVIACAANHRHVLEGLHALSTESDWCIVLEDDALPIDDFRIHAAAALEYVRSPVAGFYIARSGKALNPKPLERAYESGIAWAVAHHLVSAVAYAIHGSIIRTIVGRWQGYKPEMTVEYRLTDWAREARGNATPYAEPRFYYTIPSLVDHWDGQSIITPGVDGEVRKAWTLGVAANWDTPAVEYDPNW